MFSAEVTKGNGEVVVAVRGEIDLVTAPVLWESLVDLLLDADRLVIDLAGTTFIDSTGLGVLVRALKRLRHRGGELVLRSPRPNARKVLSITCLDRVMTIED
ncbi:MAG: STAS domain-containing protein [Actinobacteria bacterium]|nr:STAS domain-containing protein [Actinomycetota bacterium]